MCVFICKGLIENQVYSVLVVQWKINRVHRIFNNSTENNQEVGLKVCLIPVYPNSLKTMITSYWGCAVCVLTVIEAWQIQACQQGEG